MPPKRAQSTSYVVRARAEGKWSDDESSVFRVAVNTDLAQATFHVGPNHLEEWNPAPLGSYYMKYLRGGSHIHVEFELAAPLLWKGALQLSAEGLAGRFTAPAGGDDAQPQRIIGTVDVEEERPHAFEVPRPSRALAEKLAAGPPRVAWEPPPACRRPDGSGSVLLVGLAGASRLGKTTMAAALAERLRARGRGAAVVEQSRFERSIGSYACSAEVNEAMYDHPSAVDWPALTRSLSKTIEDLASEGTADAPPVVILEGTFALWAPALCQPMARRLLLRGSQTEVLRRRQASAPLAEPFVEHVLWPMWLQHGQPQVAPWEEIRIDDGVEGFPLPEGLVDEALDLLGLKASVADASVEPLAADAAGTSVVVES